MPPVKPNFRSYRTKTSPKTGLSASLEKKFLERELCLPAKRPDESGRGRHECPRHEIQDERSTRGGDDSPHMTNFIEAVRSRNYKSLNAEIEIGAMSAALGYLANIAFRLGRELMFDPVKRQFINDREADKMLTRDYRKGYVAPDKE